ncbi:hypothetical protein PHMEG_00024376 [Phytophthora megakarya]|uniref:RxLR effector protein n=1 Tax=Phytophthora megakarya TaxID=4795 RepID=A0A225VG29_9STRA|nr:hypothetical protein PHMEG_00024376 [Phytophthora megakarya]
MRFQLIVLFVLTTCVVFCGDTTAAITTRTRFIAVNQYGAPAKRLLRADATPHTDNNGEEERAAWIDKLTQIFKTKPKVDPTVKILTKLDLQDPDLKKFTQKYDLTGAFKALKLNKFKTVDELFTSRNYEKWYAYMLSWNTQSNKKPYTVAKMFNKQFGSKKAFKMFTEATKSKNPFVQQMGHEYQIQLFYQFYKTGDKYKKFVKILGSEEEAGKMFAALTKSPSWNDRQMGGNFATALMNKWADKGMTHAQVVKIDQSFDDPYFYVLTLKAREKQGEPAAKARAAAAAAEVKKAAVDAKRAAAEAAAIREAGKYARRV